MQAALAVRQENQRSQNCTQKRETKTSKDIRGIIQEEKALILQLQHLGRRLYGLFFGLFEEQSKNRQLQF